MGKVKEFVINNSKFIELFLSIGILILFFSISIYLIGLFDITIFITFKNLLFILFSLISFYTLLRYERSKKKDLLKKVFKGTFLTVLILQVLSVNSISFSFSFITDHTLSFANYSSYINFLFVLISLLLLFTHREEINEKEEKDISNRWAYVILIGILILFTWIKAPYFNYNFTGAHSMKYNTYVEPAKYMVEKNDFTWYQQKYLGDPVDNPQGIRSGLPQLPLLEWMLATTFKLMPNNSIEFNTRLVTHTIGIVTLLFTFLLVRKWSNNIYALISTLLMATNAIVSFATFVTVLDGLNFMLLIISLFLLSKYLIDKRKLALLSLSGILIGLGMSIKISFLIWILPASLLFIVYKTKKFPQKVYDFFLLYTFAGLVYLTTRFSIPSLKSNTIQSVFILSISTVILLTLSFLVQKFHKKIKNIFLTFHKKKLLVPSLIVLTTLLIPIGMFFLVDENLLKNFLTDRELLFNFSLYRYMVLYQFIPFVTLQLFLMSLVGYIFLIFIKNIKFKEINIIFLISAIFFWITASKSIFPHSYYTEIIMFAILLGSTTLIYFILKSLKHPLLNILFLGLLSIFLYPLVSNNTRWYLQGQIPYFKAAAVYLEENTDENDIYIDESYLLSLTLETGRARVGDLNHLSDEKFKEDVKSLGFKNTMEKYNIKYLITSNVNPNYMSYVHIFTDEYLESCEFDRGQVIEYILDPINYSLFSDEEYRNELVEEYDLESKFVFEKEIGVYRFFRFSN